ncbi:alkaline phosphatase [Dysgonomonas sp. 25]|uniref:alkaline phosphatase n=1 Tax=Dysgonomonas sp. 25 TaxID=2302933 RepID=UPI0013D7C375|nr:alkaline phosphatase [Dysgonomonas sp. 25]NDV70052.1 alkaline phosphatase [Dysgonomonas sp. 25]
MKRIYLLTLLFAFSVVSLFGQYRYKKEIEPVKNVILMIPDGTSIGVVSAARWYKKYNKMGEALNLDPYMCGTVITFSSNAPIGDSAPTTAAYMTGMPQQSGNVSIYPLADPENDMGEVDPTMAYQPLLTILEGARLVKNKATGLVVTSEFPHATPADCAAHYYSRGKYEYIASQMAYQHLDVVFGGGNRLMTEDIKQQLRNTGTTYLKNDIEAFRNHKEGKLWALFAQMSLPYDLDRNADTIPSLEEMTRKAIDLLSQNENGFFLMVEGSKVDWTAHSNDAIGCITELLAFDDAVGAAVEFAKENGNTAIVILPDHGNSGFTIGRHDLKNYDRAGLDKLFGNVSKYKKTASGLERILLKEKPENFKAVIKQYTDIDITDEELAALLNSKNYKYENYMKVGETPNMTATLVNIMNKRTYFGFTTGGHTGEEVFLAAYHPQGAENLPIGVNNNVDIHEYMVDLLGIKTHFRTLTEQTFAKHTNVLKGVNYTISKEKGTNFPMLVIKKGKNTLEVPAFKSVAYLNKKQIDIASVTIYIDKNDTFYIPANILDYIK